ncbi:MAG: alpha/beta hydrolase [Oscillospiraceae bacterium]|nr:alpha/beta hydrolase [Oscillospiraceae bacterium]
MLYNVKENTLNLSDIQMDYVTFGYGTKPMIMIQGLNTNGIKGAGISLAFMYRIFAKDYKVYLFDRRADISHDITVEDLADDIAAAMDELHIKSADILGVSMGGMIAQYLAINRPDLVHKMVLAVTLCRNNETVTSVINNWINLTIKEDYNTLVTGMAEKMYSEKYLKRYRLFLPLLTLLQKPKDKQRFITLTKACLTCSTYENLDKIKCPVLVIGGGEDKIVGAHSCTEIAEKAGCKIHIYDDLGHAAYEEAKDFNKIIYDFFRE